MLLNITRPIVFFDLETTGVNIVKDRIVEISILKVFPNGNKESKTWIINPTIPIPNETTQIHGITDEKVKNEPTFKELFLKIYDLIKDCDLAGYNSNKFDIPLLIEEFLRCDKNFSINNFKAIDIQNIFHKMEQRTLSAAYKFYCNKELINAHSAEADTVATYEILLAQLEKYDELKNDTNFLSEFFLTQESIKQLPGPMSLLVKPYVPNGSSMMVIFDIPPIFKIHIGKSNLRCVISN